jgi:hypothetical protein
MTVKEQKRPWYGQHGVNGLCRIVLTVGEIFSKLDAVKRISNQVEDFPPLGSSRPSGSAILGSHVAGKGKKRTMDLSKASPRELAIELGKRSAGSGMPPTKTLAALVKAGLDKKTRAKVTKNEKELAALIRRATDSFWQHEAAIDWQNGSFPEIVRKTYITAFIKGALEGRNEGGS